MVLLAVDQDEAVHLLHTFLSTLDRPYSIIWKIFALDKELPESGIPLVLELPVGAYTVQRAINIVPRSNHISHLGEVTLLKW